MEILAYFVVRRKETEYLKFLAIIPGQNEMAHLESVNRFRCKDWLPAAMHLNHLQTSEMSLLRVKCAPIP